MKNGVPAVQKYQNPLLQGFYSSLFSFLLFVLRENSIKVLTFWSHNLFSLYMFFIYSIKSQKSTIVFILTLLYTFGQSFIFYYKFGPKIYTFGQDFKMSCYEFIVNLVFLHFFSSKYCFEYGFLLL